MKVSELIDIETKEHEGENRKKAKAIRNRLKAKAKATTPRPTVDRRADNMHNTETPGEWSTGHVRAFLNR